VISRNYINIRIGCSDVAISRSCSSTSRFRVTDNNRYGRALFHFMTLNFESSWSPLWKVAWNLISISAEVLVSESLGASQLLSKKLSRVHSDTFKLSIDTQYPEASTTAMSPTVFLATIGSSIGVLPFHFRHEHSPVPSAIKHCKAPCYLRRVPLSSCRYSSPWKDFKQFMVTMTTILPAGCKRSSTNNSQSRTTMRIR
jgi:hypothetical protein